MRVVWYKIVVCAEGKRGAGTAIVRKDGSRKTGITGRCKDGNMIVYVNSGLCEKPGKLEENGWQGEETG